MAKFNFSEWFAALDEESKNKTILNKAIFHLSKRDYSRKELKEKLVRKYSSEYENIIIDKLDFLEEKKWLSDERFAENFVKAKINRGLGWYRIQKELKQKGVGTEQEDLNIDLPDFSVIAEEQVLKKYSKYLKDWQEMDFEDKQKLKMKIQRFLAYRGLPSVKIESVIEKL